MVKLDKVSLSSLHDTFRNREIFTGSLTVSGSVSAGSRAVFNGGTISFEREGSIVEGYYRRTSGGSFPRRAIDTSFRIPDWSGPGGPTAWIGYGGNDWVEFRVAVENFGSSSINITTQTYEFTLYVFDTPFSDL